MKRVIRNTFAVLVLSLMFLTQANVNVYAQGIEDINVRTFDTDEDGTYIVSTDNKLYMNTPNNGFEVISDDVKEVFANNNDFAGDICILKTDNTLWLFDRTYDEYGKYSDNFMALSDNVKTVTDWHNYVLKNDGTLCKMNVNFEGGMGLGETAYPYIQTIDTNVKDVVCSADNYNDKTGLYIKNDNTLWRVSEDKTTEKIMDNVSDAIIADDIYFVLDTKGDVYAVGRDEYRFDEYTDLIQSGVKKIESSNQDRLFIIKNDFSLWGVGSNEYGALGGGISEDYISELTKIADDVVDVSDGQNHTVYLTKSNDLYGFGDNSRNQLGDIPKVEYDFYDENGRHEIMTNAEEITSANGFTTVIKDDKSLWTFGPNSQEVETPIKIAENVVSANFEADDMPPAYITGDDNSLNYTTVTDYYREIIAKDPELYKKYFEYNLKLNGLNGVTNEMYNNNIDFYNQKIYEFYENITSEEINEIENKKDEFVYELIGKRNLDLAKNVKTVCGEYYLTNDNVIYKLNPLGEDRKIKDNVNYISAKDDGLYFVDSKNEAYYFNFEDDTKFEKMNLSDVKSIREDEWTTSYLKTDGTFIELQDTSDIYGQFLYRDNDGKYYGKSMIDNIIYDVNELPKGYDLMIEDDGSGYIHDDKTDMNTFIPVEVCNINDLVFIDDTPFKMEYIASNVKDYDAGFRHIVFLDENNTAWGYGENFEKQITNEDENYYNVPVKIEENVKSICASDHNTFIVRQDGTLYGRGSNPMGELGFKGLGRSFSVNNVYEVTKLK